MKYYNHHLLSTNFKNFLISENNEYNSYLIDCVIAIFLYDFRIKSINENICNKIFDKIFYISEADDGYIIINEKQNIKLGRFISKIAKELNIVIDKEDSINIERFIDIYKSWYKSIGTLKFKILKGEQLLNGYDDSYYAKRNCSMLSGSCMNNKFDLLDVYVKNEDKVNLLVLTDSKNRIHGRSLLWNLDNKPYQFMDRVYGLDNYIIDMFKKYAIQHKFAHRCQDNVSNYFKIYLPSNSSYNYSDEVIFKTKINLNSIKKMPYMDSLYIWNKWDKTLSNKSGKNGVFKEFRDTRGRTTGTELKLLGIKLKSYD